MDDKKPLLSNEAHYNGQHAQHIPSRVLAYFHFKTSIKILFALLTLVYIAHKDDVLTSPIPPPPIFNWHTAPSHATLTYTPCYDNLQCALLTLPMDPLLNTTNTTIDLAIVRRPAAVPVTDPRYGGAILVNPGGPGGSGVGFVVGGGAALAAVVDAMEKPTDSTGKDAKYFDIIGFDPRGVGFTRPQVSCFASSTWSQSWNLRMLEEGLYESSDAAFGRTWGMTEAYGRSCSVLGGKDDIKEFMSTAFVATDMKALTEAHGEWREAEARRLMKERKVGAAEVREVMAKVKYEARREKILYWGFSYGSYLGMTYAAMYPETVGRLVVDGVVDAYGYRKALWLDNLVDTEKSVESFYSHCAEAGFPYCALADGLDEPTAADVRDRLNATIQGLLHNPLPVVGPNPDVITYSDLRGFIFMALYSPMSWKYMAAGYEKVRHGDASQFEAFLQFLHDFSCDSGIASGLAALSRDAIMAIACSDSDDQTGTSKEEFAEHFKNLTALSPTAASTWARHRLGCIHYSVRSKYRFKDPWTGNTSHPLLFVGNTADPVTPGRYAVKMAKGFNGAVALIQDSPGHCSNAVPSKCTMSYIRQYMQAGVLPPQNTTCAAAFDPFEVESRFLKIEDVEQKLAKEHGKSIERALWRSGGGFMTHALQRNSLDLLL